MSYVKQTWINNVSSIDENKMNHIENGIYENSVNLEEMGMKNNDIMGIDAYDNTSTYTLGDYCIYNNNLYKCISNISEPENWNSEHWNITSIKKEITEEIITAILTTDQIVTTSALTKINLNMIKAQTGNNLTLENGSITIGSGINYILVSAQMMIEAHETDELRRLFIYKNSNIYARTLHYIKTNYETMGIANMLIPVTEGDEISLYTQNGGSSTTINGSYSDTYLTVQVIN